MSNDPGAPEDVKKPNGNQNVAQQKLSSFLGNQKKNIYIPIKNKQLPNRKLNKNSKSHDFNNFGKYNE